MYYRLVNTFGGVPIIKEAQNPTLGSGTVQESPLNVPRSSTADCITFICDDLDAAANMLPSVWSNAASNYGRVTRGAAMALKGRLLLAYASPLFNRANDVARWDAAQKANQAAYDELTLHGERELVDASANRAKNWGLLFTEGLTTAFLLYCMGSMTIVGAIQEGRGACAGNGAGCRGAVRVTGGRYRMTPGDLCPEKE